MDSTDNQSGSSMDRFAIASFLLGLLAAACFVFLRDHTFDAWPYVFALVSLLGVCAGCRGLYGTLRRRNRKRGLAFAIPGMLLCSIGLLLFPLSSLREGNAHPVPCSNRLKQLGIVFQLFANERPDGLYPILSPEPGRLMFANDVAGREHLYPHLLTYCDVMFCPKAKGYSAFQRQCGRKEPDIHYLLDDHCYFYLGYVVTSDEDVEAFARAYSERIRQGQGLEEDILASDNNDDSDRRIIRRLSASVSNASRGADSTSRQSRSPIPVLIERLGNHEKPGANVLYLDGRVDFVPYPGPWPMTEKTMSILNELDSMGATE